MSATLRAFLPETLEKLRPQGPRDYYEDLADRNFVPGWARLQAPLWPQPRSEFLPAVWRFRAARAALERAGSYVPIEQIERRNLIMANPAEGNRYASLRNLVAAFQMIQPGETAAAHRHSPNALRLVVEASPDLFTTVDGERIGMAEGDIVLTPNWCWHGHGNQGAAAGYWIDFLDVPFVQSVDGMFFEPAPPGVPEPLERSDSPSPYRFAAPGIVRSRGLLAAGEPRSVPIAAGLMKTIALSLEAVPAGQRTASIRMTANSLYAVVSGACRVLVDDAPLGEPLTGGDVAAIPLWRRHRIDALTDTVLLRVTDEPIYRACGLFRSSTEV